MGRRLREKKEPSEMDDEDSPQEQYNDRSDRHYPLYPRVTCIRQRINGSGCQFGFPTDTPSRVMAICP